MTECIWKGKDGVCILHSQITPYEVICFCVEGPCPDDEREDGESNAGMRVVAGGDLRE